MTRDLLGAALFVAAIACGSDAAATDPAPSPAPSASTSAPVPVGPREQAIFGGGCFWCMEGPFEAVPGVLDVVSGYAGGHLANPTYKQVGTGTTGHAEVVQVTFDPSVVSYEMLLDVYWRNIDPFDFAGQFCDKGNPYRPALFPQSDAQRAATEASLAATAARLGKPVAPRIEESGPFWPAEGYHQDYYKTHSLQYAAYRTACGRDAALERIWGEAPAH